MTEEDDVAALATDLAAAETVVALTGAGVSTASGIPDFRSEGGVWETHDRSDFHYHRFQADPEGFWQDRVALRTTLYGEGENRVEPNAAHEALATMEERGHLDALVTQNVDGLHAEAGSETVVRIHGTGQRAACQGCGRRVEADEIQARVEAGEVPPRCESCDGVFKPDVVLFGEPLPQGALQRAQNLAGEADVFLSVGSSLSVEPAASLPVVASHRGATVADVNLDSTRLSGTAEYECRADVTEVLPALVAALD
ncbi:SIR2 family NAD-dependent protein deacylase [Halobacteriales archaeon Cl-PHB]